MSECIESHNFRLIKLPKSENLNDEYCFHSNWLEAHWQEDATETLRHIGDVGDGDWMIIDHYALDRRWEAMIRPHVDKIMVIDDLADRKHLCDLLLDQNYYSDAETRYKGMVEPNCQLLISPKYALLREEFTDARSRLERKFSGVKTILISFGGIDLHNDALKAMEAIVDFEYKVIVVAGGNREYGKMQEFCQNHHNYRLCRSVTNMAELMTEADLAISAGGSTSLERAALGLPTLGWPIAENQVCILKELDKLGAVRLSSPEKLAVDLPLLNDSALMEMSRRGVELCDAEGTVRVANKLWSA